MYYVYVTSGPSLLIESTDSMIPDIVYIITLPLEGQSKLAGLGVQLPFPKQTALVTVELKPLHW